MSRITVIFFTFAIAYSSVAATQQPEARKIETGFGDMRVAFKIFQDCSKGQFGPCIKHKVLTALDRLNEQPEMEIYDGVRLVKDPALVQNDVVQDHSSSRSSTTDENNDSLESLVMDRIVKFFKSRSLQFRFLDKEARDMSDGRKKSNKYNSLLMYPFMMSGMTIPLAFGVLALLAGKALIIAKLALTLSALLGLKKMFSDDSNTHGYISNSGGHYRRSMPGESAASNMAYNSYMPGYEESIIRSTPTTS